jgi:hypothetical protein
VCISNHSVELDADYYITFIHESAIIREAYLLKQMDSERKAIKKMIDEDYKDLDMINKVKLQNNIINTLVKNKLVKNGNYVDTFPYEIELMDSVDKINAYIDYLNDYYLEDLKHEEDLRQVPDIFYVEPEQDVSGKRGHNTGSTNAMERANEVMAVSLRKDVLDAYPYIYRGNAYTTDKSHFEYMSYLYLSNGKYILVMEPYNGVKHTKIAIIDANREITKDEFTDMVQYYLQLSYRETISEKTVVRTYHTTIDKYSHDINYAITGNDENIVPTYFKGKVKALKEQ